VQLENKAGRARILIVDDDRSQRELLRDTVQRAGYQADTAEDGASALQLAARDRYDFALLDFQMPGLNGIELFTTLHQSQPWLRAVIITAYGSLHTVYPAVCAGVARVLPKPVDPAELLSVMDDEIQPQRE
jgi:DNA-binding NtrC family response regulator